MGCFVLNDKCNKLMFVSIMYSIILFEDINEVLVYRE